MKIRLLSVGKPKDRDLGRLHDRYAERIVRFGVPFEAVWVPDARPGKRFSEDHAREREARSLLERIERRTRSIALDRRGRARSSEELARVLESWATPGATFILGGPLGLHFSLLEQVDETWSLSSLTLPHELARVVVVEQLYRALTLLRGVPYHR